MRLSDRATLVALGGVLGYAAFRWGGVERPDQYVYLLALGVLAIVVTLGRSRDERAPLPGLVVRWAAALLPAYVLFQVLPLPVALLRVLSPARAEGVAALEPIGAKVNFASLSVSPAATFQSFLLVCGYVIIFLVVRELTWRFGRLRVAPPFRAAHAGLKPGATSNAALKGGATVSQSEALRFEGSCWLAVWPIVAIGAFEAALGLWQYFGGAGEQVGRGTYVNRDHYAGFLEMALPFAVMYPVALLRRARRREYSQSTIDDRQSSIVLGRYCLTPDTRHLEPARLRSRWYSLTPDTRHLEPARLRSRWYSLTPDTRHLKPAGLRSWWYSLTPDTRHLKPALWACAVWALAALMFAGIVFSLSRMGFIATLFSLFVMGTLAFGTRQLNWVVCSRKRQAGAVGMVATLVLAGLLFLPPDKLILRFAQIASVVGLTAEGRINLWAETIPLVRAYPFFGCGLGGYETAFWRFNVAGPLVTDDFAHNDYLQLLAELGLVGFAIGATLAFSVVRMAVRRAVSSADPGARYLAVAGAGALAAILLHSLADFNLYIPANAMLLAWIAGTVDFRLTIVD